MNQFFDLFVSILPNVIGYFRNKPMKCPVCKKNSVKLVEDDYFSPQFICQDRHYHQIFENRKNVIFEYFVFDKVEIKTTTVKKQNNIFKDNTIVFQKDSEKILDRFDRVLNFSEIEKLAQRWNRILVMI